ncbi:hypothetical protein NL676_008222 [Syzygium grande]|nr:hypothetical protein NL676_008222 [Syzygium grande]
MAEAIIRRISDLLDDLPKDRKSWAVAGGLHKLKKTVSALRSVVRDAEKRLLDDFMDQQFVVDQTPEESENGCKSLPPLGELTSLKRLEIGALPIMEYTESDLRTLSSLPNLSALRIWESPNLERIPPLLQLKELKLPSFPLELQTSVATIEHVIGIDDRK